MALPAYASAEDRFWHYGARLRLLRRAAVPGAADPHHRADLLHVGRHAGLPAAGILAALVSRRILQGDAWIDAAKNSLFIGISTTILAMALAIIGRHGPVRACASAGSRC